MTKSKALLGVTLAPILLGAAAEGPARAPAALGAPIKAATKEIHLKLRYSGSAMSTYADPNSDGVRAGTGVLGCTSNLGRCTSQGVGEAVVGGPTTCPNGNAGITLTLIPGTGHGFTRFDETGDLLFAELVEETVCYDPATRMHFKSGTGKFTGGTGRFAGATGQYEFEGKQWVLYLDAEANGFAAQSGTIEGTILLHQK